MTAHAAGAIARVETRHFSFEAHGVDDAGARLAMARLLEEHGRQCSLADGWADDLDVTVTAFAPGAGMRDGDRVTG